MPEQSDHWNGGKQPLTTFPNQPALPDHSQSPSVSVIIPVRSEAGNLPVLLERMPRMGSRTELIFVEGQSTDDSAVVLSQLIASHREWDCQLLTQSGSGKGDAVRMGFAHANGDILMILDADLSVAPEDLPRFYHALASGEGELINGVRQMQSGHERAMPYINRIGNQVFTLVFSWLLKQKLGDTLCGTKVLWRSHYQAMREELAPYGMKDPFGDFDLLLGAACLGLSIADVLVPYHQRSYGVSKIHPWKDGWRLLKCLVQAARRMRKCLP